MGGGGIKYLAANWRGERVGGATDIVKKPKRSFPNKEEKDKKEKRKSQGSACGNITLFY